MNFVCKFFSPSTGIQEEEDSCELGKQDLYQLNQWIQVKKKLNCVLFLLVFLRFKNDFSSVLIIFIRV